MPLAVVASRQSGDRKPWVAVLSAIETGGRGSEARFRLHSRSLVGISLHGNNILIESEEICGIVFRLNLCQLFIGLAADAVAHDAEIIVCRQEIEVEPPIRIRPHSRPELARPGDVGRVLLAL